MDQARSTISKIFNGEPHSYTRFNLTQNMEGDGSQVEMKLSSDVDEEAGGNGVGEHLNHNAGGKRSAPQALGRTPKNLCFMAAATLLIFIIGYLIGYLVHRNKDVAPVCAAAAVPSDDGAVVVKETGAAPLMDWDDVKTLFAEKFSAASLAPVLRALSSESHRAGSPGDEALGNKVLGKFKEYGMKSWTDEHFVKVQDAPTSGYNRFTFKSDAEQRPAGFLSYSATGTVKGAVLYGHYGQEADFSSLRSKNIDVSGRVLLVRAGRISLAEKVANAARANASAVLVYPDLEDFPFDENTALFGHVHMGSGDPYTPGFPSFNHTQFPPVRSSGLPRIPAQTISKRMATDILRRLGGPNLPEGWRGYHRLGDESDAITVQVGNELAEKKITNVFGVIPGFVDADRYVVIGAQRDAWGPGFAASTVGTGVLVELARAVSDMVKNEGFKPRRSIVFASFSAGEYGSVGATEWLEGYLSSLSMKACAYVNLDGIVTGQSGFKVAASPLLHGLVAGTLSEVKLNRGRTLSAQFAGGNWEANVLEKLTEDSAAYPFQAFSGIPSVAFRFISESPGYPYLNTMLDTWDRLSAATAGQVPQLAETAGRFAGHVALRLVHDHLLRLDLLKYDRIIRSQVAQINQKLSFVQRNRPELFPTPLTMQWLISASGSFGRAARSLAADVQNSDLEDAEMCRLINDRMMTVERSFLSPYVSPRDSPFRHILLGSGPHTLKALSAHLDSLRTDLPDPDVDRFRNQFALATWTVQGCANSLAGNIWSLDNEI